MARKIVITGGGTGGHVFPALAMAKTLKNRAIEVIYIGSDRGFEARLAPKAGIPLLTIQSGAIKNQNLLTKIVSLFKVILGMFWALDQLKRIQPVAVIGVGGYVSVPVCLAAYLKGIPIYLQEQNASVGIANRFLGKLAKKIFLGFASAERFFNASKCEFSGNPLRREFDKHTFPEIQTNKPTLLILGGSLGARAINHGILSLLPMLSEKFPSLSIVHQTGKLDFDEVERAYDQFPLASDVYPFIDNMIEAYSNASLVVARAGALTVSELRIARRPTLFVPYPRSGQNDQVDNAKTLEDLGVARVVEQGPDFQERFAKTLFEMLSPEGLTALNERFPPPPTSPAVDRIVDAILLDLDSSPQK